MHFIITHPDHRELVTRVYFKSDPAMHSDGDDLAIVLEEVKRDTVDVNALSATLEDERK